MKEISSDAFDLSYMSYNPKQYEDILMTKIGQVRELFATNANTDIGDIELDIYRSPMAHCRFRCRFAIMLNTSNLPSAMLTNDSNNEDSVLPTHPAADASTTTTTAADAKITSISYAKWENGSPSVMVKEFPIAAVPIYLIMPLVAEEIVQCEGNQLTRGLQAIHFLCTYAGSIMITLIYHNRTGRRAVDDDDKLDSTSDSIDTDTWRKEAMSFKTRLIESYLNKYGPSNSNSASSQQQQTADTADVVPIHAIANGTAGTTSDVPLLAEGMDFAIHIIGRDRHVKVVLDKDYLMERLDLSTIHARSLRLAPEPTDSNQSKQGIIVPAAMPRYVYYRQIEDGFTNPNALVNMCSLAWLSVQVEWILRDYNRRMTDIDRVNNNSSNNNNNNSSSGSGNSEGSSDNTTTAATTGGSGGATTGEVRHLDMLELYCGNGNHSAVISKYLRSDQFAISGRVLAVESNENLCRVATENMKLNDCSNVEIMHCPSAFVTRTLLNTKRPKITHIAGNDHLNHLVDQDCCFTSKQAPYHSYIFEIILVDPPRAGLDDITRKAVAKYPYILYISCSPTALHRDLLQVSM